LVGIRHAHEPWEWSASVSERKEQYAEAVSNLAPDYFAPFSRASATGLLFSLYGEQCLWWQKPTPSSPVAPAHAVYPQVPTLVLEGDLDRRIPLELGIKVAAVFPDSTLVLVAGAGHATTFGYQCAANLASQFIESLQIGDLSCTRTPETVIPAVGRFPPVCKERTSRRC
jgi:pimeloyl-ACP methyl ester carboxylesterase